MPLRFQGGRAQEEDWAKFFFFFTSNITWDRANNQSCWTLEMKEYAYLLMMMHSVRVFMVRCWLMVDIGDDRKRQLICPQYFKRMTS